MDKFFVKFSKIKIRIGYSIYMPNTVRCLLLTVCWHTKSPFVRNQLGCCAFELFLWFQFAALFSGNECTLELNDKQGKMKHIYMCF